MSYYCLNKENLLNIIDEIQKYSHLNRENLLSLCIINSSGVNDVVNITKEMCCKCNRRVNSEYDHRQYEGDQTYSSEWNCCSSSESPPKCNKCHRLVNNEYDHRQYEGDYTYSSEWNCSL